MTDHNTRVNVDNEMRAREAVKSELEQVAGGLYKVATDLSSILIGMEFAKPNKYSPRRATVTKTMT